MKIDLNSIDRERFRVRESDGLTLINPDTAMWDWRDDELHMRSLLCRDDGEVISAGFPKFFNYGERKEHSLIWKNSPNHTIHPKVDGTLIIASIVNGKVHLRTRGNHNLGSFHDPVWKLAEEKRIEDDVRYRVGSLSKKYCCEPYQVSVLYEYVSPDNLIVVKYDEENLIYLASVIYKDKLKVIPNRIFRNTTLPPFESGQDFADYVSKLSSKEEGFVVNFFDYYHDNHYMMKFKTDWYVRLHGLMTETESRVDEMLFYERIFTEDRFCQYFQGLGYDWETCMHLLDNKGARAKMDAMRQRLELTKSALIAAKSFKAALKAGESSRKEIALYLKSNVPKEVHGVIFGYLDDRHEMPALSQISGISAGNLKTRDDLPALDMLLNYE